MSKPTLYVQRLSEAAVLPKRGSALAAGWDLAAAKAQGGACAALDAFEAESLKPDRDESLLAVHWMDVKLQNLQAKKDQLAGNATTPEPGLLGRMKGALSGSKASGLDETAPYAKGVFLLATECGAYVDAEKISVETHDAFCERCAHT